MCVTCDLEHGPSRGWGFRYYIGGWRNFVPRRRGEGSPAPWMIYSHPRFGIQIGLQRSRPWLKPELYWSGQHPGWALGQGRVVELPRNPSVRSLMWGFFILTWKVEPHGPQT